MTDYTIRQIPDELWRKVKAAAAMEGITIKQYIIKALHERLERQEQQSGQQD